MPTVSICLPVFNGARYLPAAIESVLGQSCEDFELLIADDCSLDDSSRLIEIYAKRDQRIVAWKNETNLGLFQNYNACIKRATGQYIKPFAQDDILSSTTIERMVSVLNDNRDVSLVACARCWIDAEGNKIAPASEVGNKTMRPYEHDGLIDAELAISQTLKEVVNWLGEPSSQMFRKEHVGGGYDTAFTQIGDLELSYRLLLHGDYYYISDALCSFRSHSESSSETQSLDLRAYLDWFLLGSKYRTYLDKVNLSEEQYCLNVVRALSQHLEHQLHKSNCVSGEVSCKKLRELLMDKDVFSFFSSPWGGVRNYEKEQSALGAIALLRLALVENDLRLIHDELGHKYDYEENPFIEERLTAVRPEIAAGIAKIKAALIKHVQGERKQANQLAVDQDLREANEVLRLSVETKDREIEHLNKRLSEMAGSFSWRITEPLRQLKKGSLGRFDPPS